LAAVSLYATEKELTVISWMAILGGCAAAAISLYEFSQGTYLIYETPEHISGLSELELSQRAALVLAGRLTNPNTLAASLILPLSLALGAALLSRLWAVRLAAIAAVAVIGVCILETLSRGALLAAFVVLMVYVIRFRPSWRLTSVGLVLILVIATAIVAFPEPFLNRFTQTLEDRGAGRVDIWNAGLHAFREHAIVGTGLDSFPTAMQKYDYVLIHDFGGTAKGPHNAFLGTSVELGIVGLLLLLGVVFAHLKSSARVFRSEEFLALRRRLVPYEAACWGLLACGFFLDLVWELYFWFAWMLLIMAVRVRQERRRLALERVAQPSSDYSGAKGLVRA
jgi:O-antigen ligase